MSQVKNCLTILLGHRQSVNQLNNNAKIAKLETVNYCYNLLFVDPNARKLYGLPPLGPVQPRCVNVPLLLVRQRCGPRGHRFGAGRLRGRHQGGPARHEDGVRGEERHAGRHLGGNSIEFFGLSFGLKKGLRFHFDSVTCLQSGTSDHSLGFKDEDLGSSPGWWAATIATYCWGN